MPLSEEEARLLRQMEQSLAAEDPRFASTLRGAKAAVRRKRVVALAGLGFVIGLTVLFAGVVSASTWLGVIGFVVMLCAAYLLVGFARPGMSSRPGGRSAMSPPARSRGSIVDRMEERWQRRQDGDDR